MSPTPMCHRGVPIGAFFPADKAGGFTDADEEVPALFAAQATAAAANARAHREERCARAGLEALIETSPVGVVVLDAATRAPVSFNREARRIVAGLATAGRPIEARAAAGYAPAVTAEAGEIARLVETKRPALVLLDLVLPGTNGIALMQTLPALAELPVIFVSAYGRGDTVARALEAGAADYIVKPFSPAELVARIKLALLERAGQEPAPQGVGAVAAIDRARRGRRHCEPESGVEGWHGAGYGGIGRGVQATRRELQMRRRQGRVVVRILVHAGTIVLLYLAFSFALYLGLQVDPLYGNIGLALTAVLVAAYVYFGLVRRQ